MAHNHLLQRALIPLTSVVTNTHMHIPTCTLTNIHLHNLNFKKKRVSFSGNVFFLVVFLKNLILAHLRRFGTVKEVLDVWAVSVNLASVNSTWILTEALGSWESLARRSPQLWLCSASCCLLCSCLAAFNYILMCYMCLGSFHRQL